MTIYKLKEDWAPFKKGDVFSRDDDSGSLYRPKENEHVLVEMPDGYLDKYEQGCVWRPDASEEYYYINNAGDIMADTFCPHNFIDKYRLSIGDCFRTRGDAKDMSKWLKAKQRLIESGARFINSAGATIIGSKRFYTVYFTMNDGKLIVDDAYFSKDVVRDKVMCFDDRGKALKSIEEHRDDWLTYLGG